MIITDAAELKEELDSISKTCTLHHTAWKRGYLSRANGGTYLVYAYDGRFGKGYTVESPSWDTTWYHRISYYIEKEGA